MILFDRSICIPGILNRGELFVIILWRWFGMRMRCQSRHEPFSNLFHFDTFTHITYSRTDDKTKVLFGIVGEWSCVWVHFVRDDDDQEICQMEDDRSQLFEQY